MPFLTKEKTNWKYILIILVLAAIVGGGILGYLRCFEREIISINQFPEIKKPEKVETEKPKIEEETKNWKVYRNEEYGFEIKYPENWKVEEKKEKRPGIREEFGWLFYLSFNPKGKEYWYEGDKVSPVELRVLQFSKNSLLSEEKQKTFVGDFPATKFITRMGEKIAWELIRIDKPNSLGYYFEFFNPIYVLASGNEKKELLYIFNQMLSTFRFLE